VKKRISMSEFSELLKERTMAFAAAVLGLVDESVFWLQLIQRRHMAAINDVKPLLAESLEIRNILAKSLGTARENARRDNYPDSAMPSN
jgi:hypothetical protein